MTVEMRDRSKEQRYEAIVDGELAGFAEYHKRPGVISFVHTEIDYAFSGRGIGTALIAWGLDDARRQGLAVLPFCPFVSAYIRRHTDYLDLVPTARRSYFNL